MWNKIFGSELHALKLKISMSEGKDQTFFLVSSFLNDWDLNV